MGLNMTCGDTQSQVQSKQKASHVRDTIVARGGVLFKIQESINTKTLWRMTQDIEWSVEQELYMTRLD